MCSTTNLEAPISFILGADTIMNFVGVLGVGLIIISFGIVLTNAE